ncbi:MAG TPA: radical SAM protein [bacterium]|jgi:uncharacterized protein|nr:radical SAM protein [Bacteroidales bacterium]HPO11275.1 radical SAM protein [bacterium]
MYDKYLFSIEDFITIPKELYIKRIKINYWVIYNPNSYSAPILITRKIAKIFFKLKDNRIKDILAVSKDKNYVANIINNLILNNIILLNNKYYFKAQNSYTKRHSIWLHITNRCNLRCPYCYIHKDDISDMSDEVIYGAINNLLEEALEFGIKIVRIKFSGGEPMLRFYKIKEVVEFYRNNNRGIDIHYAIITNGTIISKEIVDFIKKEKIEVSISMDGNKKYFNKTRIYPNGKGCFDQVIKNIRLLKENGIKPYILLTITSKNIKGLPSFVKFAIKENLGFRFSIFKDYNSKDNSLMPDEKQLIFILKRCYFIMKRKPPQFDIGRIHLNGINIYNPGSCGCAIGRFSTVINWNGDISLCQLIMDKPICSYENGVISSINKQKQFIFRYQDKNKKTDCDDCIWRNVCGGNCPLSIIYHHGDCFGRSPNCKIFKSILPTLIDTIGFQMYKSIRR